MLFIMRFNSLQTGKAFWTHPAADAIEVTLGHEKWDLPGVYTTVFPVIKRYPLPIVTSSNFDIDVTDPDLWNKPDLWL